jgi:electron-transferring-flavoprotein dehydrogenase
VPKILPIRHQPELPLDRLILREPLNPDAIEMDVVFVGAGPAGLAGAIRLKQLVNKEQESGGDLGEVNIAVLEKAGSLGEHNLSGAVVNPRAFRTLFPELKDSDFPFRQPVTGESVQFLTAGKAMPVPVPPTMRNHGNFVGSICEIVRWMGEKAESLGVNIFPGFPVDSLIADEKRIIGVRTTPAGLERDGTPGPNYSPPTDVTARVTVLAEGTRGALGQAYRKWQGIASTNPQLFALGVKEVWQIRKPLDRVIHTLGWPLPTDAFGGSFAYPLGPNQMALGLVVGTDYRQANLDVHILLQRMKQHPLFRELLEGGEMLEWGAKTIPEGGYYSLPQRYGGDGLLMVGDTAGFVDVPSLRNVGGADHSPGAQVEGLLLRRSGSVRPRRGRELHRLRLEKNPQYATGLQVRVYHGRREGWPDDGDGGSVPGWPDRGSRGCGRRERGLARRAVSAGQQAHLQQGGRGVQVGQRNP